MRIHQLDINDIQYQKKEYSDSLLSSVKRIGLSIPVKVRYENSQYYCQDGHKRLSAIASIEDPVLYDKRRKINVIIINNGDLRSNDCWRSRNMH